MAGDHAVDRAEQTDRATGGARDLGPGQLALGGLEVDALADLGERAAAAARDTQDLLEPGVGYGPVQVAGGVDGIGGVDLGQSLDARASSPAPVQALVDLVDRGRGLGVGQSDGCRASDDVSGSTQS